METSIRYNIYDKLIILIIAAHVFGHILSPFTAGRIITIFIAPFLFIRFYRYRIGIPPYAQIFLWVWFLGGAFSLLYSYDPINGAKFLVYNICSIINFIAIFAFSQKAKKPMKSITLGWILLFILTIPVALNEFINGAHLPQDYIEDKVFLSDGSGYTVARQYASVTFGNLNNYVLVCCFCLPFALLATHLFIKRIVLTWGIVLVLLSFIAINASRGGFLCAALAVFVYLCVSVKKKKIKVKTIIVAFTLLSIPILYYFQQIFLQLTIRLTEHSLFEDYARLLIYGNVLEVVADTNGFGAGIGGLTSALLSISTTDINAAHNFFLEFLGEYGVIPFILFSYMIFKIARTLIKKGSTDQRMCGFLFAVLIIPLSVINSVYIPETIVWVFISSFLAISCVKACQ